MRLLRLPGLHHDSSAILISNQDESILINPGTSWYQVLLAARIESLSYNPNQIWLTHRHYNVAGAAFYLSEQWGSKVYCHSEACSSLAIGEVLTTNARAFDSEMALTPTTSFDIGSNLLIGSLEIEVMELPGHTSCGVGFYLPKYSLLIAGGVICAADRVARWDFPTGSRTKLFQSLKRVSELNLSTLIPLNGPAILEEEINVVLNSHMEIIHSAESNSSPRPKGWSQPSATCSFLTPP